jgi:prostaglandin-H2 D-isomerase / glutathione transferase
MKVELKYFDVLGRGEVIRIMLHGAYGSDWKDTRITFSEWPTVKPTLPLSSVPVLRIDDTEFTQSISLQRYVAKLVHLYPTDPLQALIVDETMDMLNELISKAPRADNDDELKIKRQEFQQTTMKQCFNLIESRIQQYSNHTNTICGVPSVADVYVLVFKRHLDSGAFSHVDPNMFNEYSGITGVTQSIAKHPIVVSYDATTDQSKK